MCIYLIFLFNKTIISMKKFKSVLAIFILTLSFFTSFSQNIGIGTPATGDLISLKRGWGDYIKFSRTQDAGYWGLHNPSGGDRLEFYSVNAGGVGTFGVFCLQNDGRVRIGNVPTIGDYKLYVERGILTERLKVSLKSSTDWSDYVFADDYKLKPLSEVETFLKKYKHLPNVPSADEVVASGIDVAQMDAKLLEKIEELTLYIINLNKKIETLEKELKVIKNK
jgi:hypothetical protein